MLVKYIHKVNVIRTGKNSFIRQKGKRIGVVVAIDKNKVGWSLCNDEDVFDTQIGIELAKTRAENENETPPQTLKKAFKTMVNRSNAYYK